MANGEVRIEGTRELRRTLKRAGDDMQDLADANARAAAVVAQWGSVTAPRRSGNLGASVRSNRAKGRARIMAGNASVPYAGPIHWGWGPPHNIRAQPWLSEAAVATQPSWLPEYLKSLDKIIARVKGA